MVQLHLDEPPEVVARVAATGVHVIKALRAEAGYPAGSADVWIATARYFVDAGAGEILLDSSSGERPAGTGRRFDWEVARQVVEALDVPVVLAGGLDPDNVTEALTTVRPAGVDVISGVSAAGARKDPARMRAFVQRVRAADSGG